MCNLFPVLSPTSVNLHPLFCAEADNSFDVHRGPQSEGENQAKIPLQQTEEQPRSIAHWQLPMWIENRGGWDLALAGAAPMQRIQ